MYAGDDKPGFVEARESVAYWQAFPRDDAAAAIIADGRWQRPPSEDEWKPKAKYAAPLGRRLVDSVYRLASPIL